MAVQIFNTLFLEKPSKPTLNLEQALKTLELNKIPKTEEALRHHRDKLLHTLHEIEKSTPLKTSADFFKNLDIHIKEIQSAYHFLNETIKSQNVTDTQTKNKFIK